MSEKEEQLRAQYSENQKITGGNYDKSLAVKCINGIFVGKKTENIISYKGIPFVGQQPIGELRWKAPVEYSSNDGVYEAYHFAKLSVQDLSIADFLVFDKDLLTAEQEGFSYNKPTEAYFGGKKVN